MVKIFSPASGGGDLGKIISDLGAKMFGPPDISQQLAQEKLREMQRNNTETEGLMGMVAQSGANASASDPIAQARMIGGGYKPADFANLSLMDAAARFGATDPRTQGAQVGAGQSYTSTSGAHAATLAEAARDNNMQSADRRYGVDTSAGVQRYNVDVDARTAAAALLEAARDNNLQSADRRYGVDTSANTQRYEFDNKPMAAMRDGRAVFVPQAGAVADGVAPIVSETDQKGTLLGQNWNNLDTLNPNQRQVLGANPTGQTPRNYVAPNGAALITYDGVTNAVDGSPLPQGGHLASVQGGSQDTGLTNSTMSGLQQNEIALAKFVGMSKMARKLAEKSPTNFGIPGFVKGVASDMTELAKGVAAGMGYADANAAVAFVRKDALAHGVDPRLLSGVFDPDKAGLETVADLIVYTAAAALAGQTGNQVSNRDVDAMRMIVGDPRAWLMSQEKYLAKLDQLDEIVGLTSGIERGYLGGVPGTAPGTQAPAPAAPRAAPLPDFSTMSDAELEALANGQ